MTENQLKYLTLQENTRHNLASEGISSDTLEETARSNRAKENQNAAALAETTRSNKARETETQRANLVSENQRWHDITLREEMLPYEKALTIAKTAEAGTKSFKNTVDPIADVLDALIPF